MLILLHLNRPIPLPSFDESHFLSVWVQFVPGQIKSLLNSLKGHSPICELYHHFFVYATI